MITKYLHLEQVTFDMIYKQRKNQGRKKIFFLRNSLSCWNKKVHLPNYKANTYRNKIYYT